MAESKQKREFAYGVGRRRTSVARVRLHSKPSMWGEHEVKKGDVYVNQIPALEYFKGVNAVASTVMEPLRVTNSLNTFAVTARVAGGGKKGQLDAFIHGLARALAEYDTEKFRPIVKKLGLLTRDPRTRERRYVGMGGKARRRKQSPKR
jgi:small subunit ribosomal protein S9